MLSNHSCWLTVENLSESSVLVRKYKHLDFFSSQRVFHPEETGIITDGLQWDREFLAKIYTLGPKLKKKLKMKVKVNKIYKITIYPDRCSCKTMKYEEVDLQLCAFQRMEEVWEKSDYYETLRVPRDATQREIRLAYLKLAKEYHPDHNSSPNAQLMFERVVEAYNTLSDEEIRKKYDTHLRTSSGAFSKSYWRQVFCVWNRHKAFQVGISTMLTITGSVLLLTSLLAAHTGIGVPISIAGGAVGGGLFASGVGGLSVALSRTSAMEDNKLYKRWLKYSFWYGIAGATAGAFTAGMSGLIGPAVGGIAGVMAAASVKGAATGICFSAANGIASDNWVKLLTKLRVDAIALELVIATIKGAALGVVFEGILMGSKIASALGSQVKTSSRFVFNNGIATEKIFHSKNRRLLNTAQTPLLLAACHSENKDVPTHEGNLTEDEQPKQLQSESLENPKEETPVRSFDKELEEHLACKEATAESINEAIELYEAVVLRPPVHVIIYHNLSKVYKVRIFIEFTMTGGDGEVQLVRESPVSDEIFRIPSGAQHVQVYFEYSPFGLRWKPVCRSPTVPHVFTFEEAASRRFFLSSESDFVRVTQVRDEFEQCIRLEM